MDNELVDFANKIPINLKVKRNGRIGKYILKRVALEWLGEVMIDVVLRQKFGIPAIGYYYYMQFDRMCEKNLPDHYLSDHEFGRCFNSKCELLLFELFRRLFVEHRGALPDGFDVLDFLREKAGSRFAALAS
jgi:hypothetical protein